MYSEAVLNNTYVASAPMRNPSRSDSLRKSAMADQFNPINNTN